MTPAEYRAAALTAAAATRHRATLDTLDELPQRRPVQHDADSAAVLRESRTIRIREALDEGRLTDKELALVAALVDAVGR